jgi:endonuclease/exonuclease/phosphatase family metal-dependent hydrolase
MRPGLGTRAILAAATAFVVVVVLLDLALWLPLPDRGVIALFQLFSLHLTLAAVLVVPVALHPGARWLRLGLVALLVVGLARFGDEVWSPGVPAVSAADRTIDVMTWNLELEARPRGDADRELQDVAADLIGFQELTPVVADGLAADTRLATRLPFKALYASPDVLGLGLLSRYPLSDVAFLPHPSRLVATAATPSGPIRVVVVHPLPGSIPRGPLDLPTGFEPARRDRELGVVRDTVDRELRGDMPVLVIGDINTSPTEPAFDRFTTGLVDAHRAVGVGTGWTYRPDALEPTGIGFVRIDVILMDPGLRPLTETTHCPHLGDHCAVLATIEPVS